MGPLQPSSGTRAREMPRGLLEAVNVASQGARTSWLLFLALTAYLFVTIAGVTHEDLLLNTRLPLPILQVPIAVDRFFLFAPLVFVFVHFGVLVQHVLLSQKVAVLDAYLGEQEQALGIRLHPMRFEIHAYFITQALAGPSRLCDLGRPASPATARTFATGAPAIRLAASQW